MNLGLKTKRRRSDTVLWQKPLHQQKCPKGKVTTQTTLQKSSIKQQLRTDFGRSVGVTTAPQLVQLTWFTGPPSHSPQQPCNQKDGLQLQYTFQIIIIIINLFILNAVCIMDAYESQILIKSISFEISNDFREGLCHFIMRIQEI